MSLKLLIPAVFRKLKSVSTFNPSVPETTPIGARFQPALGDEPRVNLIVPTLNPAHVFGGVTTAIVFFEKLADTLGVKRRMIVTDEGTIPEFLKKYTGYTLADCAEDTVADRQVVPFSDRAGKTIPVGKNDIFVATGWWTAFNISPVIDMINDQCGESRPMVYFIQDYEPYFYPWSSRSALAESTYHPKRPIVAVFNSSELHEYFRLHGYHFDSEFDFAPVFNASLKKALFSDPPTKKEKKIIVYGRPSVPRNCMEIVAQALREWAVLAPDAAEWELISAGEKHPDLTVGAGCVLRSSGKMPIEDYAKMMGKCYAGISLMVSPHPSYPPLEMSTFGVKTITNTYENKDLSGFNENIVSMSDMTPTAIAKKLVEITNGFSPDNFTIANETDYCKREEPFGDICDGIKKALGL